jgi:glutamyl-tRNA synthetase
MEHGKNPGFWQRCGYSTGRLIEPDRDCRLWLALRNQARQDEIYSETSVPNSDGRFAPSPTGPLHLGNLRTALLAWLFARSAGARFLVRVEDLDRSRVRPGTEEAQLWDLRAIGLDWDGPVVRQSERMELYEEAIERLGADGLLYPCYCTRAEIRAAASAPHGISAADRYPGTCRELTALQRAKREAAGRPPALRVRSEDVRVAFEDRLLGRLEAIVDDFVVRRNDGTPAYQLAVVVDDARQGIGEVVRGADLVDSTPRQILLARLLGLPEPTYAHVPLVLGPDGQRLAKRHGAVALSDRGEGPDAVRSWMARTLGLAEAGETPSTEDLLDRFDSARLPREPTVWSPSSTV